MIRYSAKIFQKTKCNMCNSPLELPSVHFLCGHSFHQHCFESYAESEAECPTCTPENRKVMDMLRAQDQKRDLHDHFNRQVTAIFFTLYATNSSVRTEISAEDLTPLIKNHFLLLDVV